MKILFINLLFKGHINPTLGLIKELKEKGYEVSYVLTREWKEKIIKLGANFIEYKDDKNLRK